MDLEIKMTLNRQFLKNKYNNLEFETLINLSYNQLECIERNTFNGLIKLEKIDLHQNQLQKVKTTPVKKN